VTGDDRSDLGGQVAAQLGRVAARMAGVRRVVAVMSGKGGVGKSLVAATLAASVRILGKTVALLDADLEGPSAARMSGVRAGSLKIAGGVVVPPVSPSGVSVISMELLLERFAPLAWKGSAADAFVWRGTRERGALREFLADVAWGKRDLLLVDLPPGSGRLCDLVELVPKLSGVVAITIPSGTSRASVQRSLATASERDVPILGVIENMAGYACPGCHEVKALFPGEAGAELAEACGAPLLGRVPFDPEAAELAERGEMARLLSDTSAGKVLSGIGRALMGDDA